MKNTVYLGLGSNIGDRAENLISALSFLQSSGFVRIENVSSFYETAPIGPKQRNFYNAAVKAKTRLNPAELLCLVKQAEKLLGRKKSKKHGPRVIDIDILFYGNYKLRITNWVSLKTPFVISEISPTTNLGDRLHRESAVKASTTTKNCRYPIETFGYDRLFGFLEKPNYELPLTIPHPEIANRLFVLVPLAEIAPDFIHPVLNKKIKKILVDARMRRRECEDAKMQSVRGRQSEELSLSPNVLIGEGRVCRGREM